MAKFDQSLTYVRNWLAPYTDSIDCYIEAENQAAYYDMQRKRKRKGGYRFLYRCNNFDIRTTHKMIYEALKEYQVNIHPAAHGFIKGRSTLTNASLHTQKKYLLHIDLKDFFDNISQARVGESLINLGIRSEVADFLSRVVTVDGVLRQGLHTSPDLSNHCLNEVDTELQTYADQAGVTYSRYGDDMTFSAETIPSADEITAIIERGGFVVNSEKVKVQKRGSNQYVTGLTVFDEKARLPRKMKKRIRLMMYYIDKYGFENHVEFTRMPDRDEFASEEDYQHYLESLYPGSANHIIGHVGYLNSIEQEKAQKMWNILNEQDVRDYQ